MTTSSIGQRSIRSGEIPQMSNLKLRQPQAVFSTLLCCLMLGGCASSGGQQFTLFPSGDYLLRSTEKVRDSTRPVSALPRELNKAVLDAYIVNPGDVLLVEPLALDTPLRLPGD